MGGFVGAYISGSQCFPECALRPEPSTAFADFRSFGVLLCRIAHQGEIILHSHASRDGIGGVDHVVPLLWRQKSTHWLTRISVSASILPSPLPKRHPHEPSPFSHSHTMPLKLYKQLTEQCTPLAPAAYRPPLPPPHPPDPDSTWAHPPSTYRPSCLLPAPF